MHFLFSASWESPDFIWFSNLQLDSVTLYRRYIKHIGVTFWQISIFYRYKLHNSMNFDTILLRKGNPYKKHLRSLIFNHNIFYLIQKYSIVNDIRSIMLLSPDSTLWGLLCTTYFSFAYSFSRTYWNITKG